MSNPIFMDNKKQYQIVIYSVCPESAKVKTKKTLNYMYNTLSSCSKQITLSIIDEIYPLAIPNKISFISMHVPSLVKSLDIYKLSSRNEDTDVSRADNCQNLTKFTR